MDVLRYTAWTGLVIIWLVLLLLIQFPLRKKCPAPILFLVAVAKVLLASGLAYAVIATDTVFSFILGFPLAALYVVLFGDAVGDIVLMLSSVLKSEIAIQANIAIMRAFVQVREYLLAASSLSSELNELKAKVDLLQLQQEENLEAVNDLSEDVRQDIDSLYMAIAALSARIEEKKNEPRPRIGFK